TAVEGVDYTVPAGEITVPAGQTSLPVQIATIADDMVKPDTVLFVSLATSPDYRIGSPSSAATFITSTNVPILTLTAGGGVIGEGGTTTFTITADQPPVKDTSVSFEAVGTAQPGQDYEPLTGTALLRAGQRQVVVVLRTINKDVVFEPTDMIAGQWPIRVGQVLVKSGDIVIPGASLFTLTDTNFTVTLVASASDRTQLQVGQSVTVQLQGGSAQANGVISQLDDNVTVDPTTKAQTYMGKISVGDLGAADGAAVSIDVVIQNETNVLTVPIAAVKQNGLGQDVVRVIDLAHGGRVTEAPVTTGLSDSSYIEVKSGLTAGQVVIVETDQATG
ncbi:MAG TPA: Calx-beta domain-containing protein, partial [Acidimicrobiales bacterium]|nr:Calx-beta domain-containing protein [Acidimicrobiales bacterium]